MVDVKKSLADLLRNHINQKLDSKFDYSNSLNRRSDIQQFIEQNKSELDKRKIKHSAVRPSHSRVLDECLKNKGIDPKSLGRSSKAPKFNTDLNPKITPEPQAGSPDTAPLPKKGAPIPTGAPVPLVPVPETFDVKAVSASINSLYLMLRTVYPDLELLSEEEKESLGTLWKSAFNKYLTDSFAEILIPIMATFGIFAPKILEARKKKKLLKLSSRDIPENLQAEADKIKKETEEQYQKELADQKTPVTTIEQQVKDNDKLPTYKIGTVDDKIE